MSDRNIGVVGLGVMGRQLARNFGSRGWSVSVYNRSPKKVDNFMSHYGDEANFKGYKQLKRFVNSLEKPRKVMAMIKAGPAMDSFIEQISPLLDKGDILIDGGNSYYEDTIRREALLSKSGIHYIGCGVSGGEEGALKGPSMMPGCTEYAWKQVKDILESAAAKDFKKKPCVGRLGENGAGHFVKMVHNGIEYGIMQMISESYQILREGFGLEPVMISEIFRRFNEGRLGSYLMEISVPVLAEIDEETGKPLVDVILDKAGQKGTGRWTARDAIDYGVETSIISQAVHARVSSAFKKKRVRLSKKLDFNKYALRPGLSLEEFIPKLEAAMYSCWIVVMDQGLNLIAEVSKEKEWNIDLKEVVRVWQGGCIIRAKMLADIGKIKLDKESLLESKWANSILENSFNDWRDVVKVALDSTAPIYVLGSGLNSLQNDTSSRTSANMIQGLRDYFGAHRFERVDKPDGETFHNQW